MSTTIGGGGGQGVWSDGTRWGWGREELGEGRRFRFAGVFVTHQEGSEGSDNAGKKDGGGRNEENCSDLRHVTREIEDAWGADGGLLGYSSAGDPPAGASTLSRSTSTHIRYQEATSGAH